MRSHHELIAAQILLAAQRLAARRPFEVVRILVPRIVRRLYREAVTFVVEIDLLKCAQVDWIGIEHVGAPEELRMLELEHE